MGFLQLQELCFFLSSKTHNVHAPPPLQHCALQTFTCSLINYSLIVIMAKPPSGHLLTISSEAGDRGRVEKLIFTESDKSGQR